MCPLCVITKGSMNGEPRCTVNGDRSRTELMFVAASVARSSVSQRDTVLLVKRSRRRITHYENQSENGKVVRCYVVSQQDDK